MKKQLLLLAFSLGCIPLAGQGQTVPSAASSQKMNECPYALFGDSTRTLDCQPLEMSSYDIPVVLDDGSSAMLTLDIPNDLAELKDEEGRVLATDTLPKHLQAIFLSVDPKASDYPHVSPYAYCMGNPVVFIDLNGERPTAYEAALMAAHVYKGEYEKALLETGWKVSKRSVPIQMNYKKIHQNGLQTMLYEKTTNGRTEYAYVYAGSNSVEDWAENFAQVGGLSPQYNTAIHNARELSKEFGSDELTFIGHSLGGGEAAAASMATGRAAITFNPAAISPYTRIIQGLGSAKDVVNYIAIGKKIGVTPFRFGGDMLNNLQYNIGMPPPGETIYINVGAKPTHSIKEFLKPNINLPEP